LERGRLAADVGGEAARDDRHEAGDVDAALGVTRAGAEEVELEGERIGDGRRTRQALGLGNFHFA
jgi:hypothetical protein